MSLVDITSHDLNQIIRKLQFKLPHKSEFTETKPITISYGWNTLMPEFLAGTFCKAYKGGYKYDCNAKKWYMPKSFEHPEGGTVDGLCICTDSCSCIL